LSTAVLALISGKFDTAFPYSLTVPLLRDVKSQMPQAMCEMGTGRPQAEPARQPRRAAL
jgi:hypothetical protein